MGHIRAKKEAARRAKNVRFGARTVPETPKQRRESTGKAKREARRKAPKRKISDKGKKAFAEIDRIRAGTSKLPQAPKKSTAQDKQRRVFNPVPEKLRLQKPKTPQETISRFLIRGGLGKISITAKVLKPVIGKTQFVNLVKSPLQMNTKNAGIIKRASDKIVNSVTWKTLGAAGLATFIASKVLELTYGGRNFGEFIGMEEGYQTVAIATRDAFIEGNMGAVDEGLAAMEEVLYNDTFWDGAGGLKPIANVEKGLEVFRDKAKTAHKIYQQLAADKREQIETGETDREYWANRRQEQIDDKKAAVDYYNEERKKLLRWEEEARDRDAAEDAAIRKGERDRRSAEERKAIKEEAAFWAKERANQRRLEAEDRKAIADFWIAYRKEARKLELDSRPSNLNFGLL